MNDDTITQVDHPMVHALEHRDRIRVHSRTAWQIHSPITPQPQKGTGRATVRRQIAQRLRSGETVADTAVEAGIAQAILFRWKRQALIDAGVIEGAPSVEVDEKVA